MSYRIVGVLKSVVKNFANFTGKHLCRVKCERKSLTLTMKPDTLAHSSFPLSSEEVLRMTLYSIFGLKTTKYLRSNTYVNTYVEMPLNRNGQARGFAFVTAPYHLINDNKWTFKVK